MAPLEVKSDTELVVDVLREVSEEIMEHLKDAPGYACNFDPDYRLSRAGLSRYVDFGENPCSEFA